SRQSGADGGFPAPDHGVNRSLLKHNTGLRLKPAGIGLLTVGLQTRAGCSLPAILAGLVM
ncbi:MAG: hypothetical protein NTU59_01945, partial [Coprothermobacterota bacterium]|nr:hypothetical protein [Coprothermobacterota bacterium]